MIVYRPATDTERSTTIRAQWINRCAPQRDGRDEGLHGVAFGRKGHAVSGAVATRMVELYVDDRLASPGVAVLVAELSADGIKPEIVGWVAHEPDRELVHFVCVPNGYGRRGIGWSLLQRIGSPRTWSWSTPNGRALKVPSRKEKAA